jgi:hypothetical protein
MTNTIPAVPNREKFEWAVFMYNIMTKYDTAYMEARIKLASAEKRNDSNKIGCEVLKFLNKWNSRVPLKNGETKKEISKWYEKNNNTLQELKNLIDIKDEDYETINECYCSIEIEGIGPTGKSKILHILKPKLFMAWDTEIANRYDYDQDANGYVDFIKKMKDFAETIMDWCMGDICEAKYLTEKIKSLYEQRVEKEADPKAQKELEDKITFFSKEIIGESIELTKLIDEYNWVTLTNKVIVPPKWHPE